MNTIELTDLELQGLYKLLDQINVSGIPSKQIILSLLIKLEATAKKNETKNTEVGNVGG